MKHFNIEIKENSCLTKNNYLEGILLDNDEKNECLACFDKHMDYFSKLLETEFNNELEKTLKRFKNFEEIKDLNKCQFSGIYIMVLDKYKQIYVGVSNNIKKRIEQHWNKVVNKDYLSNSINQFPMGIDCFKALDTTRIYVKNCEEDIKSTNQILNQLIPNYKKQNYYFLEDKEAKIIKFINPQFVSNKYIRQNMHQIKREFW